MLKKLVCASSLSLFTMSALANNLTLCVFDLAGAKGDTMYFIQDYAIAAKQWNVDIQPKAYTDIQSALADFEAKKCGGLVADNFTTKSMNKFMGTIGAIGAIPNYQVAHRILLSLSNPKLSAKFKGPKYELVGYIPYGFAYFFTTDRSVISLEQLVGKRVGVLKGDPPQRRMAQKVGMTPLPMDLDNILGQFKSGNLDIVPLPLIAYQALDGAKVLGQTGGVINYPVAFMTMNVLLHQGQVPADFGEKSRQWFSQKSEQGIKTVKAWEKHLPKSTFYDIPKRDYSSYDRLTSQLRKEFIDSQEYDPAMITLMRHLNCSHDPTFVECKK